METGVYFYNNLQGNSRQIIFISVKPNGIVYGRKTFVLKRISFTFSRPEEIFPLFKSGQYSSDVKENSSPLVIHNDKDYLVTNLAEGSAMYEYYTKHFIKCDISFRVIEHLYENYKSLRDTFKEIMNDLGQEIVQN